MGGCCSSERDEPRQTQTAAPSGITHDMYYSEDVFERVSYIPDEERETIRSGRNVVQQVLFVANNVLETGGNHWCIYLQTGRSASVRLNLSPTNYPGRTGALARIEVQALGYAVSNGAQHVVAVQPVPGATVSRFIDALVAGQRHHFEFTQHGRGCRGWALDTFALFSRHGLIIDHNNRHFQILQQDINHTWVREQRQGSIALSRGTYYRVTRRGVESREQPWA